MLCEVNDELIRQNVSEEAKQIAVNRVFSKFQMCADHCIHYSSERSARDVSKHDFSKAERITANHVCHYISNFC